jgi:hypothetical protein
MRLLWRRNTRKALVAEHDLDITTTEPEEHPRDRDAEEVELFLDATTMRSRIDFDPEFAQSVANLVSKAAQIVEESRSIDRDKPPPLHSLGAYNKLLDQRRLEFINATTAHEVARLRQRIEREAAAIQQITAEAPALPWEDRQSESTPLTRELTESQTSTRELSPARIFVIGGLPVATTAVGAVLLVESATTSPVVPNPYVALFIFLAGLALGATAVAALRERRRS